MSHVANATQQKPILETRGDTVCFEVFKGSPEVIHGLFLKLEYLYLLAPVYAVSGVDMGKQSLKYNCACTVSQLVDVYIKKSSSHRPTRQDHYPVRNREYQDINMGYSPLSNQEMEEFKNLLRERSSERFNLSFQQ